MFNKVVCFYILVILTVSVTAQQLTKEEEAIKQAIFNAAQAYENRDFDEWQKWVYHGDGYYLSNSSANSYEEFRGWNEILTDAKRWAQSGPIEGPRPNLQNFQFTVGSNLAFVTYTSDNFNQTRVMIKEDGIWKELYVGMVDTKSYMRQQQMVEMQKLRGAWAFDAASLKVDPPFSFDIVLGDLTVTCDDDCMEHQINFHMDAASGNDWTYFGRWRYVCDHSDNSIHVMSHTGNSFGDSWVHIGKVEPAENQIVAKTYARNDPSDQLIVRTLSLKDMSTLHEVYEWHENGKLTRSMSWDWKRK
jgi:hypothetical protein